MWIPSSPVYLERRFWVLHIPLEYWQPSRSVSFLGNQLRPYCPELSKSPSFGSCFNGMLVGALLIPRNLYVLPSG